MVYYGSRYYSPSQGRFLGRDPSGEAGGLHLYGFCRNNAINSWDYLGMKPNGAPDGKDATTTVVEVRDGIVYNVVYKAVLSDMDGFGDWVWDDGDGGTAVGTLGNDGTMNLGSGDGGTRGMPETGSDGTIFGSVIIAAATPPVVLRPAPTRSITFMVGFDSSVTVTDALKAQIQANIDTFQTLLNGTDGLNNIQVNVAYVSVPTPIAAPTGGNYDYTTTFQRGGIFRRSQWTPYSNASSTAGQAAVTAAGAKMGITGIPVLVTAGTITVDGVVPTDPAQRTAAFTSNGGFVITTAGLGSSTGMRIFAHETGHVGNYDNPTVRPRNHSQTLGNIMTIDHSGLGTDQYYINAINRVAVPIPRR